jgi:hypothetical protein
MRASVAFSNLRGTFTLCSMAARAAFNSARAASTGSSIPSGTAVRGTGTCSVIGGLLHGADVCGDG